MKIIGYYSSDNKEHWLGKIKECEWSAAKFLHKLLSKDTFRDTVGENSDVLMLTEGDELVSFCTLAENDAFEPIIVNELIILGKAVAMMRYL